ncbi:hypothetical protein GCM10023232_18140 [Sphingosinicella ginsenosidimutans]|nr:cytochrome b/b6 domain-containing protein [Sphingosinicella ginsenosidimutans]
MLTVPDVRPQRDEILRYGNGAVVLHWVTAALVIAQVIVGFTFKLLPRGPAHGEWFAWHKTLGATILLLALVRLAWRLAHKPPPFPETLGRWERIAATWNHRAFYALLILLPLTGLVAVSDGARSGFVALVGGLKVPAVPGVSEATGELSGDVHVVLVFTTLALLVLHVGAALKHQFFDSSRAAGRMPPFRERRGAASLPGLY